MKRLISFSIWGEDRKYIDGALRAIKSRDVFYPDWTVRIYHSNEIPEKDIQNMLSCHNVECVKIGGRIDHVGLFWRFFPMFDDLDIERFIVRDTDSDFTQREVDAVNQWIDSGLDFHVIRDAPVHNIPILGGTWGAVQGCVPNFREILSSFIQQMKPDYRNPRGIYHNQDQIFLCQYIYPIIRNKMISHIRQGYPKLRFPCAKEIELPELEKDGHYVGMVV